MLADYQPFPHDPLTSFLNTCSSFPPSTNHFLDHKKLRNPSSFMLACPVRTTVFRLTVRAGDSADAEFIMGNEDAYAELEKLDLPPVEPGPGGVLFLVCEEEDVERL